MSYLFEIQIGTALLYIAIPV